MKITSPAKALLLVLGTLIIGVAVFTFVNKQGSTPVSEDQNLVATSTPDAAKPVVGQTQSTKGHLPLLSFISPQAGARINAAQGTKVQWQFADPSIRQVFPADDTYVVLHLVDANGGELGVVGGAPSPLITATVANWNIASNLNQKFYELKDGGKYKIRAELAYQPQDFTCDPAVRGECAPVYSIADQTLIDKAKQYKSESGWFTVSLDGYVRPAADIDDASLTLNSKNATIRGTSNLKALKLNIVQNSKYFVDTTVSVVDGKWSYEPALPNGSYYVTLWDTSGFVSFPSEELKVSK